MYQTFRFQRVVLLGAAIGTAGLVFAAPQCCARALQQGLAPVSYTHLAGSRHLHAKRPRQLSCSARPPGPLYVFDQNQALVFCAASSAAR